MAATRAEASTGMRIFFAVAALLLLVGCRHEQSLYEVCWGAPGEYGVVNVRCTGPTTKGAAERELRLTSPGMKAYLRRVR